MADRLAVYVDEGVAPWESMYFVREVRTASSGNVFDHSTRIPNSSGKFYVLVSVRKERGFVSPPLSASAE
jgi:hypothetical protein